MQHEMTLAPEWFELTKAGAKKVEFRLFDAKRREIRLNDDILFKRDVCDCFKVTVKGLEMYKNFYEAYTNTPCRYLGISIYDEPLDYEKRLLGFLNNLYPLETQEELGVVVIRFELKEPTCQQNRKKS